VSFSALVSLRPNHRRTVGGEDTATPADGFAQAVHSRRNCARFSRRQPPNDHVEHRRKEDSKKSDT
jgi:hypothetical protein